MALPAVPFKSGISVSLNGGEQSAVCSLALCNRRQYLLLFARIKITISHRLVQVVALPFEFLQYLSAVWNHDDGFTRQRTDQKFRSVQSARFHFSVNDFPFLFRYPKGICDRSISLYFLFDNFLLPNFLLFLQRVLGESISPNEASGTLGKWLATCVPRHYENRQSAPFM